MPKEQMIIVRNEYPDKIVVAEETPETVIEPIKAKDITEGDYHKILTKSFKESITKTEENLAFPLTLLGSVSVPLALMIFIFGIINQSMHLGVNLWLIISIPFTMPFGLLYLKHRFLTKPKKLKKPIIKAEGLFAKIIDAFNQRIKMFNLLGNEEISKNERIELTQKLIAHRKTIIQGIEDFRRIRSDRDDIEKLRGKLDHTPLTELPIDTTEIDVVLEGGIIAKETTTTESEKKLNIQLQTLLAKVEG